MKKDWTVQAKEIASFFCLSFWWYPDLRRTNRNAVAQCLVYALQDAPLHVERSIGLPQAGKECRVSREGAARRFAPVQSNPLLLPFFFCGIPNSAWFRLHTADQIRCSTKVAFVPPNPKLFDMTVVGRTVCVLRMMGNPQASGSSVSMFAEAGRKPSRIASRQ